MLGNDCCRTLPNWSPSLSTTCRSSKDCQRRSQRKLEEGFTLRVHTGESHITMAAWVWVERRTSKALASRSDASFIQFSRGSRTRLIIVLESMALGPISILSASVLDTYTGNTSLASSSKCSKNGPPSLRFRFVLDSSTSPLTSWRKLGVLMPGRRICFCASDENGHFGRRG